MTLARAPSSEPIPVLVNGCCRRGSSSSSVLTMAVSGPPSEARGILPRASSRNPMVVLLPGGDVPAIRSSRELDSNVPPPGNGWKESQTRLTPTLAIVVSLVVLLFVLTIVMLPIVSVLGITDSFRHDALGWDI